MFTGDAGHVVFLEFFLRTGVVEVLQLGRDFAILRFLIRFFFSLARCSSILYQVGLGDGWWGNWVGYFRKFRGSINLRVRVGIFDCHGLVLLLAILLSFTNSIWSWKYVQHLPSLLPHLEFPLAF